MRYFKNAQIAKTYNVSNTSVFRWVEAALENKNNLQLIKVGNKYYIDNNEANLKELQRLKEQGSKYRTQSTYEVVRPEDSFYEVFTESETIEIINSIKSKREIPVKYIFTKTGGESWNAFVNEKPKSLKEKKNKTLEKLMVSVVDYITYFISSYEEINIVNIGQGNILNLESTFEGIQSDCQISSFTAIDISKELLDISSGEIKDIFPNSKINLTQIDIENHNIEPILFQNKKNDSSINIIFFLGSVYGSVSNKRKVLENIRSSMDEKDLLIISNLAYNKDSQIGYEHLLNNTEFIKSATWIPKLLNLDISESNIGGTYDPLTLKREIVYIAEKDQSMVFEYAGVERNVEILKGEQISLWQHTLSKSAEFTQELYDARLESIAHFSDSQITYNIHICKMV